MKKALIVVLPLIFTAQACNFLFGDLSGNEGSGVRGVFMSQDGGQSWEAIGKVGKDKNLAAAQILNIFIEPANPNNILAATFNAGVYGSDNGGQNWVLLLPKFGAYTAFISPSNSQDIFVAGNRNSYPMILKSPDRGGTWVELYSQPAGQGSVSSLIMDPRNSSVLFAGLTSGTIIKSLDGGHNWNSVTDFDDRIVRIAFSTDARTIYALCKVQGLKKSQDGGRTWSELALPEKANAYNDLVVDERGGSTIFVANNQGLFVSFDAGEKWTELSLPVSPELDAISAVAVNPQNNRQIFATIKSTIYRSDDRGATWRTESLPTNRVVGDIAIDKSEPNKIYVGLK